MDDFACHIIKILSGHVDKGKKLNGLKTLQQKIIFTHEHRRIRCGLYLQLPNHTCIRQQETLCVRCTLSAGMLPSGS